MRSKNRQGITLVETLLALGILIMLASATFFAYSKVRARADETRCDAILYQMGFEIDNFRQAHQRFPTNHEYYGMYYDLSKSVPDLIPDKYQIAYYQPTSRFPNQDGFALLAAFHYPDPSQYVWFSYTKNGNVVGAYKPGVVRPRVKSLIFYGNAQYKVAFHEDPSPHVYMTKEQYEKIKKEGTYSK